MEHYADIKSPFTGGKVKEISTIEEKIFRKEKYRVHVRYYVCVDTGEQFTTTEQDTLQFNDLYSQYRIRHGIPFPDEIKEIRTKYGLNYSQISKILGFGVNQYAKYESGEVPSESNGKMIAAIADKNTMLSLLKGCKDSFQHPELERILTSINMCDERNDEYAPLHRIIFTDNSRSIFNGYGSKNVPKLFDMVRYIVQRHGEIFPTKLNKLMFYADFNHYRKAGQSISGLQYRALNFGPVPDHYATIYDNVPGLDKKLVEAHEMVSTLLSCPNKYSFENLSDAEKESIDYVVERMKPLSVSDAIEASHQGKGWKQNSSARNIIAYDEAFDLKLLELV